MAKDLTDSKISVPEAGTADYKRLLKGIGSMYDKGQMVAGTTLDAPKSKRALKSFGSHGFFDEMYEKQILEDQVDVTSKDDDTYDSEETPPVIDVKGDTQFKIEIGTNNPTTLKLGIVANGKTYKKSTVLNSGEKFKVKVLSGLVAGKVATVTVGEAASQMILDETTEYTVGWDLIDTSEITDEATLAEANTTISVTAASENKPVTFDDIYNEGVITDPDEDTTFAFTLGTNTPPELTTAITVNDVAVAEFPATVKTGDTLKVTVSGLAEGESATIKVGTDETKTVTFAAPETDAYTIGWDLIDTSAVESTAGIAGVTREFEITVTKVVEPEPEP